MADRDFRAELTRRVVEGLQHGRLPWQQNLNAAEVAASMPFNPVSGTRYQGANRFALQLAGRTDPRWCTYRQAEAMGWQVRRGERSTLLEFWKLHDEVDGGVDSASGQHLKVTVERERPLVRYANVFNAQQMSRVPELDLQQFETPQRAFERLSAMLTRAGVSAGSLHESGDGSREALEALARWTGDRARLGRTFDRSAEGGAEREELRVRVAAFFLASHIGVPYAGGTQAEWVSLSRPLQHDPDELFRVARDAEQISTFAMRLDAAQDRSLQPLDNNALDTAGRGGGPTLSDRPQVATLKVGSDNSALQDREVSKTPTGAVGRAYLNVPFAQIKEAKSLGARFDVPAKRWYVPDGMDMKPFSRWNGPKRSEPARALTSDDFEQQFVEALHDAGLVLPQGTRPVMDGRWHACFVSTSSQTYAKKGSYKANLEDEVPNGYIKNNDTGYGRAWFAQGVRRSEAERERLAADAQASAADRQHQLTLMREQVARRCEAEFDRLPVAGDSHPYLLRKGVEAFGLRQRGSDLIVPMRDRDGRIWNLQRIEASPDGLKLFESGGQKTGRFHVIGDRAAADILLVCEGYATGASLHMSTGLPVIVAFDSGNLDSVIAELKPSLGNKVVMVAGDDDVVTLDRVLEHLQKRATSAQARDLGLGGIVLDDLRALGVPTPLKANPDCVLDLMWEGGEVGVPRIVGTVSNVRTGATIDVNIQNAGREKALLACEKHNCAAVFPTFHSTAGRPSDFNDLASREGGREVRAQINAALHEHGLVVTSGLVAAATAAMMEKAVPYKCYVGPVMANTADHAVQDVGRRTAVAHDLAKLDRVPPVGQPTRISYEADRGRVEPSRSPERQNGRSL